MKDEEVKTEVAEMAEMPAENENTSSPNAEISGIIQRFIPDADVSTPEGIIAGALQLLQSFVPLHDKLYDLASNNPETAATLGDWLETGSLVKAIARNFSDEERNALIEELEDSSYEEDRKMYSEKTKSIKDRQALLEANMSKSQMGAQEFVDEMNLSKEQVDEFIPFVDQFISDVEDRNLSKANWMIIWKAFKRDSDVAEAEENGRVIGRNEKIVAERKTRDDIKDILPESTATSAIKPPESKPKPFGAKFMEGVF